MKQVYRIKAKSAVEAKDKAIKLHGYGKYPPLCAKNHDGSYRVAFV